MNFSDRIMPKIHKDHGVDEFMSMLVWVGNGLIALAAWALVYTGLPAEPAAILAVLMCVDFVAGISRAHALGESVTSHRMKVGAITKCGVLTVPLVMALTAKGLGSDFTWLVQWTVSVFILSETYSIIANIYAARTGILLPEFDAVSAVLKKVRSLIDVIDKRP